MNDTTLPDLRPELADAFLTRLDELADAFVFCAFDDTDAGKPPRTFYGELYRFADELERLNRDGYGIFVAIHEMRGDTRSNDNATRARCIVRDYDNPDAPPPDLPLEPSLTVATSPGKQHDYILSDDLELGDFAPLQGRMIADYGSDPAVKDLARVMRLPGFWNMKNPAAPYLVTIIGDNPELRYSRADILDALPVLQCRSGKRSDQTETLAKGEKLPDDEWQRIGKAMISISPDCDYAEWLRVGQALHATGDPRAFARWDGWSARGDKYPGTDDLRSKWDGFNAGGGITVATLFHIAQEHGYQAADLSWLNEQAEAGRQEPDRAELQRRVDELAKLSKLEYSRERKAAADTLGVRVGDLDEAVRKARGESGDKASQGKAMTFDDPEPWPDSVDGAELLDDIRATLNRFLVLPDHADVTLALWVLFTWTIDAFDASPVILLTSPEKQCGKTRTLSVLARLVRRPLATSNATGSVLFRAIQAYTPTLLIDEADTFLHEADDVAGVINSGFSRDSAYTLRNVGDNHEAKQFSTWCPKLLAMIKKPRDTILDRSLVVPMKRKAKGERVERLHHRVRFTDLQRKAARWAADNLDALRDAEPDLIHELDDRGFDKWEPLLAIADHAGRHWPALAKGAALAFAKADDDESLAIQLLQDIREIFTARGNSEYMASKRLLEHLGEFDDRPWCEWGKSGKPMTPHALGRILKPFGVTPRNVQRDRERVKCYALEQLADAWERYL